MCASGKMTCTAPGVNVRVHGVQVDWLEARQRWVPATVAKKPSVTTGAADVRMRPTMSPFELIPNGDMFPSSNCDVAAGSSKTVNVPCGLNTNPWLHRPIEGFTQLMEKRPTISPASLMPPASV